MVALKNKMDLAYGIAVGSSLQIALPLPHCSSLPVISSGRRWTLIFNTVRSGCSDDFGPDCGIRGDGRRIELAGRCDVGRGLPNVGDRLFFLPA